MSTHVSTNLGAKLRAAAAGQKGTLSPAQLKQLVTGPTNGATQPPSQKLHATTGAVNARGSASPLILTPTSVASGGTGGKGYRSTPVKIKVRDYINFKPSSIQTFHGRVSVDPKRVQEYRADITAALTNPSAPCVITANNEVVSGNTRQQAAWEEVQRFLNTGVGLDPNYEFYVNKLDPSYSRIQINRIAIRANIHNVRAGTVQKFMSALPISTDVLKVVWDAFEQASPTFVDKYTAHTRLLAEKVAAFFNSHASKGSGPGVATYFALLRANMPLDVTGDVFYTDRSLGKIKWVDAEAHVDLHPYLPNLVLVFKRFTDVYLAVRTPLTNNQGLSAWDETLGNGSQNFAYPLLGLAFNHQLVVGQRPRKGQIDAAGIINALLNKKGASKSPAKQIADAVQDYQGKASSRNFTILRELGV